MALALNTIFQPDEAPLGLAEPSGSYLSKPRAQSERRMQARAYNLWTMALHGHRLPALSDCEMSRLRDFAPNSVILEITTPDGEPAVRHIGAALVDQCGLGAPVARLSEVPGDCLLGILGQHLDRCLASRAPFGFGSELLDRRSVLLLYRGIALPFASDGVSIDVVLCAVNWKEIADPELIEACLAEVQRRMAPTPDPVHEEAPLAEWADGPAADALRASAEDFAEPADELRDAARALAVEADTAEHLARELRIAAIAADRRARDARGRRDT